MLRGRQDECAVLDGLLEGARAGRSAVLVVLGEAGIGKTTLLEYAIESAADLRVIRAVGVESKMELAFAALHELCAPLLDRLERLLAPQRNALEVTFGLGEGAVPYRFFVGASALGLLAEVADERPLLCVVDDAQWLDKESAEALVFVARRLLAEPVVMLFATRHPVGDLLGLPELVVGGLGASDASELLGSVVPGRLDEQVRKRIVAETRGNPLALIELTRGLSPAQLAGGFGLPTAPSLEGRIEERFVARVQALHQNTRLLLLVAAADPTGDLALLWHAAGRLGLADWELEPAVRAGLLEVGTTVRFRHPLVRSAVYRSASPAERRRVHAVLADVTDPNVDADRCAWHRAHAAPGADEEVASELERSADRAHARGGLAAAAAFLERASGLTLDPANRARRALAAAQANEQAGAPDAALGLLASAEIGPLDELQWARADVLRGQIAFAMSRGRDAPALLLNAAKRIEPLDLALARETYLDALSAATFVGRLSSGVGLLEVARAARAAPSPPHPAQAADLLLDGLAQLITDGWAAGAATLRQALVAFRADTLSRDTALRWLWLAGHAALDLWDDESWHTLAARHVRLTRESGALTMLPIALHTRVGVHLGAGEFAAARALLEEADIVTEATGGRLAPYNAVSIAAFQGRADDASGLVARTSNEIFSRGEGIGLTLNNWAIAVLYNGLGRYEEALAAAEVASAHPLDLRFFTRGLVELVEAASRAGNVAHAMRALEQLSASTQASGTELALGMEARARALLCEGAAAENLYREAIERLGRTRGATALARAHLVYGEWLRREHRRADARTQLHIAHEMLAAMGMDAFAGRAERELLATGERVRKHTVETREELTAQEAQIARLAREGLSSPEIGARLFISPRTVEYHLHKVFTKLGIGSRTELKRALPGEPRAAMAVGGS